MEKITASQLKDLLLFTADRLIAARDELCAIDAAIGDGDHGLGMAHGFEKVKTVLSARDFTGVNEIFQQVGMAMLGAMGGASGVIFATLFMGAARGTAAAELTADEFAARMENALTAIQTRGKAQVGDKTMVDALAPACDAMRNTDGDLTARLSAAAEAAEAGAAKTAEYEARFGRAKALGERAIGHRDAGAVSTALIFRAMADWAAEQAD
ncbi:MAG: dihydroxyacetone kinase subunit L [Ruminococcaceae bacterium]|nr:dihydroxyacetone kinase subunit L [Oscillospiraceae bacterium]